MKTRTINLNFDLKSVDGKTIAGNAGAVLGQHISVSNKGDAIKLFGWATAFHKGEDVIMDQSDFNKLKEWVDSCDTISILTKAQILSYLDNVKYEKD